jgi:hypothetical protein
MEEQAVAEDGDIYVDKWRNGYRETAASFTYWAYLGPFEDTPATPWCHERSPRYVAI